MYGELKKKQTIISQCILAFKINSSPWTQRVQFEAEDSPLTLLLDHFPQALVLIPGAFT